MPKAKLKKQTQFVKIRVNSRPTIVSAFFCDLKKQTQFVNIPADPWLTIASPFQTRPKKQTQFTNAKYLAISPNFTTLPATISKNSKKFQKNGLTPQKPPHLSEKTNAIREDSCRFVAHNCLAVPHPPEKTNPIREIVMQSKSQQTEKTNPISTGNRQQRTEKTNPILTFENQRMCLRGRRLR
jgi:hypothetical protein